MKESKVKSNIHRGVAWLDPGNLLLLIYVMVIAGFLLLGGLSHVEAAELGNGDIDQRNIRRGELLLQVEDSSTNPAPLLAQKVEMKISGITARVKVEQEFVNTTKNWTDALYVFPLPDESSVDHLRMQIGDRVIEGQIKEKREARQIHERARMEGRKSSLLEQNRANIFSTSLVNIGPGERITVVIEYQQTVNFSDSVFSIRLPMVVAPRYIPGKALSAPVEGDDKLSISETGWALNTDQVEDAAQITPPVDLRGESTIPVSLSIDLAAGFPIARVDSLYHGIRQKKVSDDHFVIDLNGEVIADRDFVLEWQAAESTQTVAALFAESKGDDQYMLLMLMPPGESANKPLPREVIFVLDVSGSMAGTSIIQAKNGISLAVSSLGPLDRFNIIVFNNRAKALYETPKTADESHKVEALRYISQLRADGGTEMKEALLLALDGKKEHERMRQVVFLTDGAVGNEAKLFEIIARRLGDSRLFTVGIGSAPNSYFMTRAARIGRGTFTYIGKQNEIKEKMGNLFAKLENPVISDIKIELGGNDADIEYYPFPIPDLYLGEPLLVSIRTGWENESIRLTGNRLGRLWEMYIDATTYGKREGIAALWARKKIRNHMEALALGEDKVLVRDVVLKTALEHHLVSKYTSLVATESFASRPPDELAQKSVIKTHLPRGWQANTLFAGSAQTATPAALLLLTGGLLLLLAILIFIFRARLCQNMA